MALSRLPFSRPLLIFAALACAAPSLAQPGWRGSGWSGSGWGGSGWGPSGLDSRRASSLNNGRDQREGQIEAARFIADGAIDRLGHGAVTVTTRSGAVGDVQDSLAYEAAMIDRLVKAGYDTLAPAQQQGESSQVAEIRIVREVLVPEEGRRKPVSGEMMVGTGTYGSTMGMALAIDLSKPKKALVSTRLEARLLDSATGKPLWEGRAEIATREGDSRWNEQAIATSLAEALFERFPRAS